MWNQCKALFWQWRGVAIAAPSVALGVMLIRWLGLLQGGEWAAYDQLLRLRPEEPRDERIAIVGITEEDYQKLRTITISDQIYADVITKLNEQEPRVIGLDDLRDQPVPPGHVALNKVFADSPNVIGIQKVVGDNALGSIPAPPVLAEKGQVGANDLIVDPDNRVRRSLIRLENAEGQVHLSLSFFLAGTYLEAEGYEITVATGEEGWWQIGETVLKNFRSYDGGYIRTNDQGYQLLINYRNGIRAFDWISLSDVLEGKMPPDWARDRVVLIGALGISSQDLFLAPHSTGLRKLPEPMPGVEVHAQQTSQILSAVLDGRPLMQTWSEPLEILWILAWSSIAAVVAWTTRYTGKNLWGYVQNVGSTLLTMGTLGAIAYLAMLNSWWIPLVPPLLAIILAKFSITAYVARTAGDIRKTFGRYLTDEVVANLLENPEGLAMGGERRTITILTSDLRGFTALSERLPPEEVVKILNLYLSYMADVITDYQGTIDEFMGDGILVLFGAPTARPDDARRAVACAIAMQQAMLPVNQEMQAMDLPPLEMGIGINTGDVVVGNIGSEKRTKYGVVGSQVNLTYRIESYTTGGQILIAPTTFAAAGEGIRIDSEREVMPKGVKEPITIYDIGGIGGDYQLYLDRTPEVFYPLKTPLDLVYRLLDGKHLATQVFHGQIVQLSARGAEITIDTAATLPTPLSNIKLTITGDDPEATVYEDIYAKVTNQPSSDRGFYVTFTAQPPAAARYFQRLYQTLEAEQPLAQESKS